MKRKQKRRRKASVRSSRARYSKALLRAMQARGRKHFSVSRRRIAANPKLTAAETALKELNKYRVRHGFKPLKRAPLGTTPRPTKSNSATPEIVRQAIAGRVVNVGQLTKAEKSALDRAVGRGILEKVRHYGYPTPKWAYIKRR